MEALRERCPLMSCMARYCRRLMSVFVVRKTALTFPLRRLLLGPNQTKENPTRGGRRGWQWGWRWGQCWGRGGWRERWRWEPNWEQLEHHALSSPDSFLSAIFPHDCLRFENIYIYILVFFLFPSLILIFPPCSLHCCCVPQHEGGTET